MKPSDHQNKNKEPKIGLVCNRLGKSGGMERSTFELIEGLKQIGIKPIIFAKEIILSDQEKEMLKGIQVEKVATKWIPRIIEDIYFSFRMKRKREKMGLDVIIGCCRCSGADIVISGGTHPGYVKAKGKKSLYDKVTIREEAKQYTQAKVVISHSKRTLDEIKENFPSMTAIEKVIYPPMEIETQRREKFTLSRKNLGIPEDKVLFLFVSSGHGRKGYDLLKKFFSETNLPVVLGICGRSPENNNLKNIIDLGYQNDLRPFYSLADFTILPSIYEPFGRTPVESLCCGTPVFISDVLGCNEIIRPECKVVFTHGDYDSFCEAMKRAVEKSKDYKKATENINDIIDSNCEIPTLASQAKTIMRLASKITEKV